MLQSDDSLFQFLTVATWADVALRDVAVMSRLGNALSTSPDYSFALVRQDSRSEGAYNLDFFTAMAINVTHKHS